MCLPQAVEDTSSFCFVFFRQQPMSPVCQFYFTILTRTHVIANIFDNKHTDNHTYYPFYTCNI